MIIARPEARSMAVLASALLTMSVALFEWRLRVRRSRPLKIATADASGPNGRRDSRKLERILKAGDRLGKAGVQNL